MSEQDGYLLVTMVGKIVESTLNYTKDGELKHKFYNFITWSDLAEIIAEIPEDTLVKMEGDLRISSYDKACSSCGEMFKAYWTDINVNNVDLV